MRDLFDYKNQHYQDFCLTISHLLKDKTDQLDIENQISSDPLFNYLSEEPIPRDILYYICSLDNTLSEEGRAAFHK